MSISIDELRAQLKASEQELSQAQVLIARCEGAVMLLKHFIAEAEKNLAASQAPVPSDAPSVIDVEPVKG